MKMGRVRAAACALSAVGFTTIGSVTLADDKARLQAYGKRLAPQCTTCHRRGSGIPSITGWPTEDLDLKSTRLNSSHSQQSRMPSSA